MFPQSNRRILVVAHDPPLRLTRTAILRSQGWKVDAVETPDQAMRMLTEERFDLVVLGRKSLGPPPGLDVRLRQRFPDLLVLQITSDLVTSEFVTRSTVPEPPKVIQAVREMLSGNSRGA